jgi:hypothetical protein
MPTMKRMCCSTDDCSEVLCFRSPHRKSVNTTAFFSIYLGKGGRLGLKCLLLSYFRVGDDLAEHLARRLLVCGASKQQQISIRILDDEILGAPSLFFQPLSKGNTSGVKLKIQQLDLVRSSDGH